jgi:hypothetical protein
MLLTSLQDQATTARMALIVGSDTFDRLFAGIRFDEIVRDILFVHAKDDETAAEIEDTFALHISLVATDIFKSQVSGGASFAETTASMSGVYVLVWTASHPRGLMALLASQKDERKV